MIDELLERVIAEAHPPLVLQEPKGDAVYFYEISDGSREMASEIRNQVKRGLAAFKERETELVTECGICLCETCNAVGRLTIKAVLHYGEAVFTQIRQFNKLSCENLILAHRLLKAPIKNKEHVLITENFNVAPRKPA